MQTFNYLRRQLEDGKNTVMLVVLSSSGSSPGRTGFCMAVSGDGEMEGSIGGGIMEHKLVELARSLLEKGRFPPFIKRQIHQAEAERDRSGMICSGEQTVAFYYFDPNDLPSLKKIFGAHSGIIEYSENGVRLVEKAQQNKQFKLHALSENRWLFTQLRNYTNRVYIFGGGHVGLAMSQMMRFLGFHVTVLDNRHGLNTMEENKWAHEKRVIDYQESEKHIPEGENIYVILMSFGYKTDEVIIRRLLGREYKYLGMMGSQHKVETLFESLIKDGFRKQDIANVFSPIGIPIKNNTPEEIAVSIAAEIINVKNST